MSSIYNTGDVYGYVRYREGASTNGFQVTGNRYPSMLHFTALLI
jgi:hypothetical protein